MEAKDKEKYEKNICLLVDSIDLIKEKLTSYEYMNIMKNLKAVYPPKKKIFWYSHIL
jgi:hypothetical protein